MGATLNITEVMFLFREQQSRAVFTFGEPLVDLLDGLEHGHPVVEGPQVRGDEQPHARHLGIANLGLNYG